MESSSLSEPEIGVYLRKEWKKEFISSAAPVRKLRTVKDDRDKQIKVLEREILRKRQRSCRGCGHNYSPKKVNLLWGYKDE